MAFANFGPVPRLYMFKQQGCAACQMAEPHLVEFRHRHPNILVLAVEQPEWERLMPRWDPSWTPAYALVYDGQVLAKSKQQDGAMTIDRLEAFVKKALGEE